MNRVFYLCNGQKETCQKKDCYTKGGRCKHTTDVKYAKNFSKKNKSKASAYWENEAVTQSETAFKD